MKYINLFCVYEPELRSPGGNTSHTLRFRGLFRCTNNLQRLEVAHCTKHAKEREPIANLETLLKILLSDECRFDMKPVHANKSNITIYAICGASTYGRYIILLPWMRDTATFEDQLKVIQRVVFCVTGSDGIAVDHMKIIYLILVINLLSPYVL